MTNTNIKKLSDYTVSDIEKILRENLSDNDMVELWNEKFVPELSGSLIEDPYIIDNYLSDATPSEVIGHLDRSFNLDNLYASYNPESAKFVSFNTLNDDKNPIDYEQCAILMLEEEDKTTLKDVLDACNVDWVED